MNNAYVQYAVKTYLIVPISDTMTSIGAFALALKAFFYNEFAEFLFDYKITAPFRLLDEILTMFFKNVSILFTNQLTRYLLTLSFAQPFIQLAGFIDATINGAAAYLESAARKWWDQAWVSYATESLGWLLKEMGEITGLVISAIEASALPAFFAAAVSDWPTYVVGFMVAL